MTSTLSDPQVARVALESLGRAIRRLSEPTGTVTVIDPLGSLEEPTYPIGRRTRDNWGLPPRLWPEVIAVTEALIGSAFAVAQAHLKTKTIRPPRAEDVEAVANYWKHRDEWGPPWGSGTSAPHARTLAAIVRLGIAPPVAPGQMVQLASAALGGAFDVESLWAAIN